MKDFTQAQVVGTWESYKEEQIETKKRKFLKGTAVIKRTYKYDKEEKEQLIAVTFLHNEYNDWSWLKNVKEGTQVYIKGSVVSREYEGKYYTDFMGREILVSKIEKEMKSKEEVDVDDLPF